MMAIGLIAEWKCSIDKCEFLISENTKIIKLNNKNVMWFVDLEYQGVAYKTVNMYNDKIIFLWHLLAKKDNNWYTLKRNWHKTLTERDRHEKNKETKKTIPNREDWT